jgi:hypothetical protein
VRNVIQSVFEEIWTFLTERFLMEEMMRTTKAFALTLLLLGLLASAAIAADSKAAGKMTGIVSDEKCGAQGAGMPDCVKQCESEGKKLVFVTDTDHSVLSVTNQDILKGHEGQHVTITAKNVNGSLTVSKVEPAK